MNCDSVLNLIATYGVNWQSMVNVISGPHSSLENCEIACSGSPTTTTTAGPTTTTTAGPTTTTTAGPTTTTTAAPLGVQPPLISDNDIFNINDFSVDSFVESSTDNGATWEQVGTFPINANSTISLLDGYIYRARCSPDGQGTELSAWSFGYSYPNPDNVAPPVCASNDITNINDFTVRAAMESSDDNGITWQQIGIYPINANSTITLLSGYIYRGRCAQVGVGISVSDFST